MMRNLFGYLVVCVVACVWACGDDDGDGASNGTNTDGPVQSCDNCSAEEVCVRTYGDELVIACEPIPSECNSTADCFEETCAAAMYDLCAEGIVNTGCSDTFAPTVISCNP